MLNQKANITLWMSQNVSLTFKNSNSLRFQLEAANQLISMWSISGVHYCQCQVVFGRMQHPVGGGGGGGTEGVSCVWMRYAKHQSCIFISWHLLTFGAFLFIQVLIVQRINTANIKHNKADVARQSRFRVTVNWYLLENFFRSHCGAVKTTVS